jgi:TRAP-type C4-dicarboxylate transport system substrate-binding protein
MKLSALFKVIVIAALAMAASTTAGAQATMKIASATINDVQYAWLEHFQKEIGFRVGNRLKVEIYPDSRLGEIPQMIEGVLTGSIESFVTPTSFLADTDPRFMVFDAVGVFRSAKHANKILSDARFRKRALAIGNTKGIPAIGIFYNSHLEVLSKKPIRTLTDFKRQKIRTFASPLQIEPMKALGALAVPMPLAEVRPALQSGKIDGLLAGITILTAFKFYQLASTVTETHQSLVISTVIVNRRWFEELPADLRQVILDAGAKVDREIAGVSQSINAKANMGWDANGGVRLRLSPADQEKMMRKLKAVGSRILSANPAVKAEYDALLKVAARYE